MNRLDEVLEGVPGQALCWHPHKMGHYIYIISIDLSGDNPANIMYTTIMQI